MHKNYLEENYLENIYIISLEKEVVRHKDIREKMNRAKSVVTKAIHILVEKGYVIYGDDKIVQLTDEGKRIAKNVYRKHVHLKDFLINAGVDHDTAEIEACNIEHVLSNDSFEMLIEYIKK